MTEPRKIKTLKDTNYFAPGTYKHDWRDYAINVGIANIITRFILAPVQRWRIIKQTQTSFPLRPLHFKSFFDYVSSYFFVMQGVPKEQGLSAFWRGNNSGIWLYFVQSLIQFGLYDSLKALQKDLVLEQEENSVFRLFTQRIFIPIISTSLTQGITYPMDTARVRISMNYVKDKSKFPFYGIRTCLRSLRDQSDFLGMYKGFLLSNAISLIHFNLFLAFASVATNVQLGAQIKNYINSDTIASIGALVLIHPLDTLKKMLQLNNLSSPGIFKNARSVLTFMKRDYSLAVFYNGLTASLVRSLLFLPTYLLVQRGLEEGKNQISQIKY